MAITGKLYGNFLRRALLKQIDLIGDNLAVTLHTSTYTPNQDTHEVVSDLANEVAAGGGYSTGGQNLASKALTYTTATNKIALTAATVSWTSSTITARHVVVSDRSPSGAANQPLILYQSSDTDVISTGGPFDVTWNASGLFEITVA